MPNTETVRALVSAFNVNNHFSNTVETNFTLQSDGKKDYIVVSFDKGMGRYQCSRYLDSIKRKIVGEFYGIEEGDTDEVVLNTANLIFNIESFPFNTSKGKWSQDEQGRIEFLAPIDKGVIFNLKSHLASSLKKDILEGMPACRIVTKASNKKDYLWHGNFDNKESRKQFEHEFLSRMRERYENVPKKPLEVKGNSVYIKDVFDDARFIDSVTRYKAWLEGMYLGVDSSTNHRVKLFKDMIVESIGESTGVIIYGFMCASPSNRKEASILIPIMQNCRGARLLTKEEAGNINRAFNYAVLNDLYGRTQAELSTNGSSEMYSIDFSNPEISHCVITKIIESSVINKDHELSIDPELPRTLFTEPSPTKEFPTRNKNVALKDSPRRESEKFPVLLPVNQLDVPGTSREFLPRSHLSSSVTNPHSSKCVGAAENVPAGTSASNPCSSPAPGARFWPQVSSFVSGPSSSKGASERRTSALTEKEKELIEALLYTFNLINYTLDGVYTNFFAKDGKIVSLLHDNVDREEYLQKVRDYIIEEYCETEEKARELYDLDEFPFKLNYEEKQGKTVVANISSGALSNLKILFSRKFKKNVDAIDISVVKEVEKREKDEWVDRQLSEGDSLKSACKGCFPDEGAMKKIPIAFEEGEYVLDRSRATCEVESLYKEKKQSLRLAEGTSKAGKTRPEGQDSGIGSSGDTTDAEKVNPNDEPMDYQASSHVQQQNPWSDDEGSSSESLRSDSSPKKCKSSLSEEEVGSPCSSFSDSGSEQLCKKFCGANLGRK